MMGGSKPSRDDIFMTPTSYHPVKEASGKEDVWMNGQGEEFRVRTGPNYSRNSKKAASLSQMYDAIAFDVFRSENRITPVTSLYSLPELDQHARSFSHPHVPPLFVLNLQVPDCPASFFGGVADGQTMHVVIFYQIRPETVNALSSQNSSSGCSPAHRLWKEWCKQCMSNDKFRARFKMIGQVDNFREVGLPSLLEGYNGKPALIKSTGTIMRGKDNAFMEMAVNVHAFPVLTKKSIYSMRGKMKQMIVHLGTTIEGVSDDELPERILFCCRLIHVAGFDSTILSRTAISWLQAQAAKFENNVVVETATSAK